MVMYDFVLQLQLVGIVLGYFNSTFLLDLLLYTERHFNFTTVPIFLENTIKSSNTLETTSHTVNRVLKQKAQYIFTEDFQKSTNTIEASSLRDYIQDDTLSLVFCQSAESKIWRVVDERLRALRRSKLLVILEHGMSNRSNSTAVIKRIFEKLWKLQFLNALVISEDHVYRYEPYPEVKVFQLNRLQEQPFLTYTNLRGYEINTTVENDIPRIFCITNPNTGALQIKGYGYQVFRHFLERLNVTFRITNLNATRTITSSVNMSQILSKISTGSMEITTHPYTGIDRKAGIMSYPIFKVQNCLIVPVRNEIPRFMYILHPFKWQSWLLLLIAVLYNAVILLCSSPLPRANSISNVSKLLRCTLESLSFILFRPMTFMVYAPRMRFLFIFTLLSVLGFFITTWYSDLLGSSLTTFLVGTQIDTFEQLIAADLPILAKYYETDFLLQQVPDRLFAQMKRLMVPVNASVQVAHLLSFNRSYAYYMTEERWIFLRLQQQYATLPVYRWSRICFGMPCIAYPMRLDSHLEESMTKFIMDVQSAGLDHYWLTADFKDALYAGYVRFINNALTLKPFDLDSLRIAWLVIAIGWFVSMLAFVVEKFCTNW